MAGITSCWLFSGQVVIEAWRRECNEERPKRGLGGRARAHALDTPRRMSKCSAAIYRNDFGLELRVDLAGELVESRLSRFGEDRCC